ncbi:MAG: hypothetical protein IJV35_02980 [Neisseriaceae bacterium]|nr:hypothetical protein [Neisseriaceae bacterium]
MTVVVFRLPEKIIHCSLLTANYSLTMTIVIKYEVYFSGCLKWLSLPRPILNARLLHQNACRIY